MLGLGNYHKFDYENKTYGYLVCFVAPTVPTYPKQKMRHYDTDEVKVGSMFATLSVCEEFI